MSQAGIINVKGSGTSVVGTLTGNSGGAVPPTGSNINTLGTGSITIVGVPATSTLTTQLTGLTNHNMLVGAGTTTIGLIAPSATSGVPLISAGASADPAFGTAVVAGGGTGATSFTAYAPICGGTTTTGALQSASTGLSTTNFVLTSNGSAALPSFQVVSASGAVTTITGNSGGAQSPSSGNFNILGTGSITSVGTAATETIQLTGLTNHNVLVGAGTATITNVAPSATSGVPLISAGASADPAFGTAVVAGGGTGATSFNANGVVISNTSTTGALASLALSSGQLVIGGTTTPAAAALTAGTGISVTNGNNSITIATTATGGLAWAVNATTTIALASNTGYITTAGSAVTATLPTASSAVGTIIGITVNGAGAVAVAQGTGQQIRFGSSTTTSGAGGSLTSTAQGDTLMLLCTTAASGSAGAWSVIGSVGNWTVV